MVAEATGKEEQVQDRAEGAETQDQAARSPTQARQEEAVVGGTGDRPGEGAALREREESPCGGGCHFLSGLHLGSRLLAESGQGGPGALFCFRPGSRDSLTPGMEYKLK